MEKHKVEWLYEIKEDGYYQKGNKIYYVKGDYFYTFGLVDKISVKNLPFPVRLIKLEDPPLEYERPGVVWNNFPEGEGLYWCKDSYTGKICPCEIIARQTFWDVVIHMKDIQMSYYMSPNFSFTKRTEI